MSDIVVDSSVVTKWFLPEVDSAKALDLIPQTLGQGGRLIAIDLIFPEVANAIWKRQRQGLITPAEGIQFLDALTSSPVHVEPSSPLLSNAYEIATQYDRSVYDALFVALMQKLNRPGITADEPLYNTTRKNFPLIQLLRLL